MINDAVLCIDLDGMGKAAEGTFVHCKILDNKSVFCRPCIALVLKLFLYLII